MAKTAAKTSPVTAPLPAEGHVSPEDIRAKLAQIDGSFQSTTKAAAPIGVAIAAGAALVVVVVAYALGRRRGRKRRTVVEIRRL